MNKKGDNVQKNQRIQVFARCRPLNSRELSQGSPMIVEVIPEKKQIAVKDRTSRREFLFDKVFSPETNQIDVYKSVVEPLLDQVLMGYNCTVFAYGQTGTGKTYTMEGERSSSKCSWEDDPGAGIIPRSLHQLFEELDKGGENVEFSVCVSFLELYNEELFDLLGSTDFSKLRIYEDSNKKGSVVIQGLEEIPVNSKDEVYAILEKGTSRRQTAATMLNATSSRSHTVFSVTIKITESMGDGEDFFKIGKLNLVDLAGSENVGRSGATNQRAREAGNINQSLLTLGRVITALIEKQPHIPYRESKLTRILQDSLGGHTKTSIIATISPAMLNLDETISTLDYATKAKSITIKPEVNQKVTKRAHIRELNEKIDRLQKDLAAARSNQGFFVDKENYQSMEKQLEDYETQVKKLENENNLVEQEISILKEELSKKTQLYEETTSKLTQTASALRSTQDALSKTAFERDEIDYLRKVHSNRGEKLFQDGQQILQVTEESTADNTKLHGKIDRMRDVEKHNEQQKDHLKSTFQSEVARLNETIEKKDNLQIQNLEKIGNTNDKILSDATSFKENICSLLHRIETNQHNSLNDVLCKLSSDCTEQIKFAHSSIESIVSVKSRLLDLVQSCNKLSVEPLVEELDNAISDIGSFVLKKHHQMKQQIDGIHATFKKEKEDNLNSVLSVRANLNSFSIKIKEVMEELVDDNSRLRSSLQELRIEEERSMEAKKIIFQQLNESNIKIGNVAPTSKGLIKELEDNTNEPLSTLETSIKNRSSHLTVLQNIPESFEIDEFKSKQELTSGNCKSLSHKLVEFKEDIEKEITSNLTEMEHEVERNKSVIHSNYEIADSKIKEIETSMSEVVRVEDSNVKARHEDLIVKLAENSSTVKDSKDKLVESRDFFRWEKQQFISKLNKFVDEEFKKDVPTGNTPQRREYEYPRELATISPDERILLRRRAELEHHTNIAINLPLDTSFEEEFKSPPNRQNSESADEEDYLTGCESNASSMSDLSVDGLKNKENWNNFVKPSHLPKLKKHKKQTTKNDCKSDKRRPLLSKNATGVV